jgi:hypothetical protein
MIIFIFRLTRVFALTAFASCACAASVAPPTPNLIIHKVELHFKVERTHPDYPRLGSYPQLEKYNLHLSSAPDNVDVVITAEGQGSTMLILDVLPEVGVTNWADREGITDFKVLEETKTVLPSFYRIERPVKLAGKTSITIKAVSLKKVIDTFSSNSFWPRVLKFRAGLLPVKGEATLTDNVSTLDLILDPPD